jgi:hypothetical protein
MVETAAPSDFLHAGGLIDMSCIDNTSISNREVVIMTAKTADAVYDVLSPWAQADPVPLHGLARRIDKLDGKKIGLLQNGKRAAQPILDATERLLKERFANIKISRFIGTGMSITAEEPERMPAFDDWLKGVDAVITAVGD